MHTPRKSRPMPEISVGSFADIAFLLIIFFVLTAEMVKPAGRRADVPSGVTDPSRKDIKHRTVNLRPDEIHYGERGTVMTIDELRDVLAAEDFPNKESDDDRIVIVDSDQSVPYEQYYQVMMAISKAGGAVALIEKEDDSGSEGGSEGAMDTGPHSAPAGGGAQP